MDLSLTENIQIQPLSALQFGVNSVINAEKYKSACLVADSVGMLAKLSKKEISKICHLLSISKSQYRCSLKFLKLSGVPLIFDSIQEQQLIRTSNAEIFIESKTRLSVDALVKKLNNADDSADVNKRQAAWSRLNGTGIAVLMGHIRYRLQKGENLRSLLQHYEISEEIYDELLKYKNYLHLSKGRTTPAITEDGKISSLIRLAYLADNNTQ